MTIDLSVAIDIKATAHGLDPKLVAAVVRHRSRGYVFAVRDQALGLMQVSPEDCEMAGVSWDDLRRAIEAKNDETAAELGLEVGCAVLARQQRQI